MEAAVADREAEMTEWNDGRLDELTKKIDDGFALQRQEFQRVDHKFEQVEQNFDRKFGELEQKMDGRVGEVEQKMDAGFSQVNSDIRELSGRFDKLQHSLVQVSLALAAGLLIAWLTLIAKALSF